MAGGAWVTVIWGVQRRVVTVEIMSLLGHLQMACRILGRCLNPRAETEKSDLLREGVSLTRQRVILTCLNGRCGESQTA